MVVVGESEVGAEEDGQEIKVEEPSRGEKKETVFEFAALVGH